MDGDQTFGEMGAGTRDGDWDWDWDWDYWDWAVRQVREEEKEGMWRGAVS